MRIGRRAAHRLQRERHLLGGQPGGDPGVGERAEVVGVGHEGVAQPGAEQGLQGAGRRQRGVDVAVPGRAPFQLRVGRPPHGQPVIGADLGLAALQEVQRHARHAQADVAAQRVQRGAAGGRGVHQHERQPGAVPLAQCQHLGSDDIQEAGAGLDLEQRLRPGQAHAGAQPAVELDDHQPVEHFTGLAGWRLGQLVQARQVRKRLQNLARQQPGLAFSQLPQAPAQGGELGGADAAGFGFGQDSGDMVRRIHALLLL